MAKFIKAKNLIAVSVIQYKAINYIDNYISLLLTTIAPNYPELELMGNWACQSQRDVLVATLIYNFTSIPYTSHCWAQIFFKER